MMIQKLIKNLNSFEFKYRLDSFIHKWSGYNFIKHDVIRPIKRIIDWIPVLWHNYDFDSHYMIKILYFKLLRMENELRDGCGVILDPNHKEYNDEAFVRQRENFLRLVDARVLAKKLIDDDYYEIVENEFKKKYGGKIKLDMRRGEKTETGHYECHIDHDYSEIDPKKLSAAKKRIQDSMGKRRTASQKGF